MDYADQLIAEMTASEVWPLKRERHILQEVHKRRAWRRGEKRVLEMLAKWDTRCTELFVGEEKREYIHDPLAKRIAGAFADFLFGDEPTTVAHNERDQDWLDFICSENRLPSILHRAERVAASEGEAWWHGWVDREVALSPLVEFVSRLRVVPLWRGDRLLAAAFISILADEDDVVWRHLEVHGDGRVVNAVFEGTRNQLGTRRDPKLRPEMQGVEEVWAHGLPILAGRIVNELDDDHELGIGEYDQIADLLLALNEARTIGAENTRLTAKKRLFVTESLMSPEGTFDAGSDVVQVSAQGGALGEGGSTPPVSAVEYSYDAAPLIAHNQDLESTILSRVGLVPQIIGHQVDGQAESGTSIRLRFLPTEIAADGKSREWADRLPIILQRLMLVDQLPAERGGFGRTYAEAGAPPTVELGSILPENDTEITTEAATAVTAGIRSVEQAVRDQHPEWSDQDVMDELERIHGDTPSVAPIEPPADPHMAPQIVDPTTDPLPA